MTLEIQVLSWGKNKNLAVLNRLMGFQPTSLDHWISIQQYINRYKQMIKNMHRFASTQKDNIPSQK
jgi:hypothetical protein